MLGIFPFLSEDKMVPNEQAPMASANRLLKAQFEDFLAGKAPINKQQLTGQTSEQEENSRDYVNLPVPIFQLSRKHQCLKLNPNNIYRNVSEPYRFAKGTLIGSNNMEVKIPESVEFIGNFEGVFQSGDPNPSETYFFYFEGTISDFRILKTQGKEIPLQQRIVYDELNSFKGFFKGLILEDCKGERQISKKMASFKNLTDNQIKEYQQKFIRSKVSEKREFFVPALVRFQIGKIRQICVEKSSALVWGTLFLTIQMNKEIVELFKTQWLKKRKHKFHVNFNRTVPFDFPFYDPSEFQATQEETEYEWDEIWQGIHWSLNWNPQQFRMQYEIETKYTVQMDNSHGIFFAPFNLNILKLTVTLHSIVIDKNNTMHISVCDLQDFNQTLNGEKIKYHPYTEFYKLEVDRTQNSVHKMFRKHIDRLTKISSPSGRDMGEYQIATNKMFLFPYHNLVFVNKNTQTSNYAWALGWSQRTAYFGKPEVLSLKDSYLKANEAKQMGQQQRVQVFRVQRWNYVHIQIPIYKYPVIDMIRIFMPIVILSAISLMIFGQENGKSNGFPLFARRIASSCNLLIAYVTLIPLIRSKLPPSPSMTLIQVVIYFSCVPNFLAVLSVYITGDILLSNFYATYRPFYDALFQISFLICSISFIILVVLVSIYISKDYVAAFTFKRYKQSSIRRLTSPVYLEYMDQVSSIRKELTIHRSIIMYDDSSEDQR